MEQGRVLVADDDQRVRETLAVILAQAGHRVETAARGEELNEQSCVNLGGRYTVIIEAPKVGGQV